MTTNLATLPDNLPRPADDGAAKAMFARTGTRTVPQVSIGGRHVGGSDELQVLDRSGELDTLLKRQ